MWLPEAADMWPPPAPGVIAILLTPLDDDGGLVFQSEKTDSAPIRSVSEDASEGDGENASDDHTLPERERKASCYCFSIEWLYVILSTQDEHTTILESFVSLFV